MARTRPAGTEGDDRAVRAPRPERSIVLHPVLFAIFPVGYLYAQHVEESIPPADLAEAVAFILGGTLVVWFVGAVLGGSLARAGLAASALVLLFFVYGPIQARLGGGPLGSHGILLPLWGLLAVVAVVVAWRIPKVREVTIMLNFGAAALVLLNLVPIVSYHVRTAGVGPDGTIAHPETIPLPAGEPGGRPDIYYLVFDTYAGDEVLREFFGHDNRPFLDALRERGFFVAERSTTNYPRSSLSIASSLNLDYLDFMTDAFGRDTGREVHLHDLLQRSRAARFLQQAGYGYVHAGSWWRPTASSPIADRNIVYGGFSEFTVTLLRNSALRPYAEEQLWRRHEWSRTQYQLRSIREVAADPRPTFLFAQVMLPHGPQVFDRDGGFVTAEEDAGRTREEGYLEQVLYANRRILALLDTLLAGPPDDRPVVVLQADEGPYEGEPSQWSRPVALGPEIERKFSILNAYHFPDRDYGDLYQEITPVNSLRVVFDRYFGTDLGLLADRNFVFRNYRLGLFDFTDVTDLARRSIER
jgi:hypothetical protein